MKFTQHMLMAGINIDRSNLLLPCLSCCCAVEHTICKALLHTLSWELLLLLLLLLLHTLSLLLLLLLPPP
jgi:hypothetical protein